MSFTEKLRRTRPGTIYLLRGHDSEGRAAWYYLQVAPMKQPLFERDSKKGSVQLTSYGDILASGFGDCPPPEVKQRMKDEYGFEGG